MYGENTKYDVISIHKFVAHGVQMVALLAYAGAHGVRNVIFVSLLKVNTAVGVGSDLCVWG